MNEDSFDSENKKENRGKVSTRSDNTNTDHDTAMKQVNKGSNLSKEKQQKRNRTVYQLAKE